MRVRRSLISWGARPLSWAGPVLAVLALAGCGDDSPSSEGDSEELADPLLSRGGSAANGAGDVVAQADRARANDLARRATQYLLVGRKLDAANTAAEALSLDPNNPIARQVRAEMTLIKGSASYDPQAALADVEFARKTREDITIHLLEARVRLELDQAAESRASLKKVLRKQNRGGKLSDFGWAQFHRTDALLKRHEGSLDEALVAVDEALRLGPGSWETLMARALILESSDLAGAERDLKAAIAAQPDRTVLFRHLARVVRMQDREEDARRYDEIVGLLDELQSTMGAERLRLTREFLAAFPEHPRPVPTLINAHLDGDEPAEAERLCLEWLTKSAEEQQALFLLARAQSAGGKQDEALKTVDRLRATGIRPNVLQDLRSRIGAPVEGGAPKEGEGGGSEGDEGSSDGS